MLRRRSAFTIVELLVVITIMGILMSLVFPAVGLMREAARRAQCVTNQSQIGKAALNFNTRKGYMPPSYQTVPGLEAQPLSTATYTGWVPMLLPYMGREDLYRQIMASPNPTTYQNQYLSAVVCPSDTQSNTTDSWLSYGVNAGRINDYSSNAMPADWSANGVWDFRVIFAPKKINKTTMDFIGSHDGLSTTILLSENANLRYWSDNSDERNNCLLWTDPLSTIPFNIDPSNTPATSLVPSDAYARPYGKHPGGFVVAFCDGSARFMNQSVTPQVFAQAMTPWGAQARAPGSTTASPPAYQLTALKESDLNP